MMNALDRLGASVSKSSTQAAFRVSSTRAALQVDICPTHQNVINYADTLLAEAEGAFHSGLAQGTVKVKAVTAPEPAKEARDGKGGKGAEKPADDGRGKGKRGPPACNFFGTEEGCKKGAICTYKHDWSTIEKRGRCWTCSSTKHTQRECTVKAMTSDGKDGADGGGKAKGKSKPAETSSSTNPMIKKTEKETDASEKHEKKEEPMTTALGSETTANSSQPMQSILTEAATLLKSLKGPAVRSVRISSLEVQRGDQVLLDGGATHALRTAVDDKEWDSGVEVRVDLAQGWVTLRQLPWSKTLLSKEPVQPIVPLGILVEIGYVVHWTSQSFELQDPTGCIVVTDLENGCPMVSTALGLELIKEVERHFIEKRARLAVLRGDGNVGGLDETIAQELAELKGMFPEVPDHILERILPRHGWRSDRVPWNRRIRKRVKKARQVVLHLFSGDTDRFWQSELAAGGREVLCVDTQIHSGQDLLSDDVMSYLLTVCDSGVVDAVIGGMPCRTMSRLRFRPPGPPPLRTRLGEERFGLHHLDPMLLKRVEDDTVLWFRQYILYRRAKMAAAPKKVLYMVEQPEDPENYLSPAEIAKQRYPSYWAFPEWAWMKSEENFVEVSFDQGPTGHPRRKPTTLGTNIRELEELKTIRGPGTSKDYDYDASLTVEERIQKSKAWASWSDGLKKAVAVALRRELDPRLCRMSLEQWKEHLRHDHWPHSRHCATCLGASGKSRPHRKVVVADSYTLSVDLAGPFSEGKDQQGVGKYFLTGCFTVPVKKGISLSIDTDAKEEDILVEEKGPSDAVEAEEDGMEILEEDGRDEVEKDEKKDDSDDWKKKVEEEEDFTVKQLTFVEIVPDRRAPSIVSAISRIYARIRHLGLPLLRLHSDRARELQSKHLRKWANDRSILRTYTDGDSWKCNGRSEAEIGVLRRHARVVMKGTQTDRKLWPLIVRHVAERRLRNQLKEMGYPTHPLLAFGSTAFAKQKSWVERYEDWRWTRRKVTIMGPDKDGSLTTPGYFVRGEDGKFFKSSDVGQADEAPEEAAVPVAEIGEILEPVRKRVTGKSKLRELGLSYEAVEAQRQTGLELLQEEVKIHEKENELDPEAVIFIKMLTGQVEELSKDLQEEAKVEEEQNMQMIEKVGEEHNVFLQTRMYSLAEVRENLEEWIPCMESEFKSLTEETGAIRVITPDEAESLRKDAQERNILFEKIPGKAIFSRKAGSGRHKCRACACGNYMSQRATEDTYAGGTGSTEVRTILRRAGLVGWSAVTLDIKTAFLRAPRDHSKEVVVVTPLHLFTLAGLTPPGSLWLVDRALYGLTTSPKEWLRFRNDRVSKFSWKMGAQTVEVENTTDQDIWKMVVVDGSSRTTAGYFVTYVDDVLAVGDQELLKGFCDRMQKEWEVGTPEWVLDGGSAVRFLGMEIECRAGVYRVHQQAYLQSLLQKYEESGSSSLGAIRTPEDEGPQVSEADVRKAQKETGEILWLANKTRPDIAFATGVMSQWASRRPRGVQMIGRQIRAYLKGTSTLALEYGPLEDGDFGQGDSQRRERHNGLVEVYTDASFASSDQRSITGVVAYYAGAPVFWITCRQSFVTLSTAESELMALLEGLVALRCVKSIVQMIHHGEVEGRMFSDSTAAISIVSGTTGSWRTRHLRIRAQGLREALDRGETTLEHQSGKLLVSDGFTKQLQGALLKQYVHALKLRPESRREVEIQLQRLRAEEAGGVQRFRSGLGLLVAVASMSAVPAEALEEALEAKKDEGQGEWLIMILLLTAVLVLVDVCARFGMDCIRSWFKEEKELKVRRLHDLAVMPQRGSDGAAGLDLCSIEEKTIKAGEYELVRTGIAVELPRESYGRIAGRSGLASRGIDVGAGVVDRDYRGEVRVLVRNHSSADYKIFAGDRIAQLIVEKVVDVSVREEQTLSATRRGDGGFGSTDAMRGATSFSLRALRKFSVCGGRRREVPEGDDDTSLDPRDDRRQYHRVRGAGWVPPLTSGLEGLMGASEYHVRDFTQPSPRSGDEGAGEPVRQLMFNPIGEEMLRRAREESSAEHGAGNTASNIEHEEGGTTSREVHGHGSSTARAMPSSTSLGGVGSSTTRVMPSSTSTGGVGSSTARTMTPGTSGPPGGEAEGGNVDIIPQERFIPTWGALDKIMPARWEGSAEETMMETLMLNGVTHSWPVFTHGAALMLTKDPGQELHQSRQDDWHYFNLTNLTMLAVRRHRIRRIRSYDFQVMENDRGEYHPMQLTLAWEDDGGKLIVSSSRRGRHVWNFQKNWTGYTVFIRTIRA